MRRETLAGMPPPEERAVVGQVLRRAFPLGLRSFEGLPSTSFYEESTSLTRLQVPPDGGEGHGLDSGLRAHATARQSDKEGVGFTVGSPSKATFGWNWRQHVPG